MQHAMQYSARVHGETAGIGYQRARLDKAVVHEYEKNEAVLKALEKSIQVCAFVLSVQWPSTVSVWRTARPVLTFMLTHTKSLKPNQTMSSLTDYNSSIQS